MDRTGAPAPDLQTLLRRTRLPVTDARRGVERVQAGFDALSELYYRYWGEYFHLAIAEDGDDPDDLAGRYERTHHRYFEAIEGSSRRRVLELACGGGAFSAWMADRTTAEVVGVDRSETQLRHARSNYQSAARPNLRFRRCDAMELEQLDEVAFDAAVCLDAACYFPDRPAVLRGMATLLEPGARFLLVDWCQSPKTTVLQRELLLHPLCRLWGIAGLETVAGYLKAFAAAGFRVHPEDLSLATAFNWERGYRLALGALERPLRGLLRPVAYLAAQGVSPRDLAKDQFQVALLAKAAADAGVLRYVCFLGIRT
jgi:SAM-dependent methyltransferase